MVAWNGGPCALKGRVDFGVVCPHWPNGFSGVLFNICIQVVHEKLIIFPHGQYIVGIYVSLAFRKYCRVRGRCLVLPEICKNVTVETCKVDILLHSAAVQHQG